MDIKNSQLAVDRWIKEHGVRYFDPLTNMALLTEERRATGIFGILNIRENTVISSLDKHKRLGFVLSDKSMKKDTQWSIDAMHTKTPSQETKIRSLSGAQHRFESCTVDAMWSLFDSITKGKTSLDFT